MSLPTVVLFSKIEKSPDETLPAILNVLPDLEVDVDEYGKLGLDEDGDLGFIGEVQATSWNDLLEKSVDWEGFALSCIVHPLNDDIFIYFWHESGSQFISVEVPGIVSTFETEEYEIGAWLKYFLLKIASAIQATACVYGRPYDAKLFSSVKPDKVLEDIKSGKYFDFSYPNIQLISVRLIDQKTVKEVYENNKKSHRQKYGLSLMGYHVLSFL